jgi:phosphatidylserine decarboxylase
MQITPASVTKPRTEPLVSSVRTIHLLAEKAKRDKLFRELLVESLQKARFTAEEHLLPALFKALPWPTTLSEYVVYLTELSKWTPQQSSEEAWKKAGAEGYQEVFDRLQHFYWLIDQEVGPQKTNIGENIYWFNQWLIDYAKAWGDYLNTPESFSKEILESFIKYSPTYRVADSMINGKANNASGWLTFNQFFARELNPGLRPIALPADNKTITCPADCTFRAIYPIGSDSTIPELTLKKTHKFASVEDLLEGSKYKSAFANGTFVHYFLSTFSYHRFHTPVAGKVMECYPIHGLVNLDVRITHQHFDAPDNSEGSYEFSQARGVITIDTTDSPYGNVGIIAIIPVGMCQVSSVNMIAKPGCDLLKGDEFGYFLFGGSDIIVLFQEGIDPKIDKNDHYRLFGSPIATCSLLPAAGKE